ncbi:MAG: hypothetical protein J0L53_14530 [Spirochaetes bacterium]|nr:hypothetical protein [Spirochaetota bacterium]
MQRYLKTAVFSLGLAAYALTAYHTHGYHQADEHFQIMEPGLAVTEARPMSELPWEFPAKMRPSLQIWLGLGLTKTFAAAGIHNRFTQMTLIRILVALLSFLLIFRLTEYLIRHLASERARVVALASVGLLWFMPYLHSRFSSEHLTAMAFVAGLLFLFKAEAAQRPPIFWAAAGFCFAASFWLRFQTAFALLPLVLYLVFARRDWPYHFGFGERTYTEKILPLALLLLGALMLSAIALAADRAFYGQTVVTPWHYFSENLLQGKAATFGVSPWWNYLRSFFKAAIPPIAVLGFITIGYFLFKRRISFIAWIFVVFLGVHFMIRHKELRFLFPLAVFLPAMIGEIADAFIQRRSVSRTQQWEGKVIITAVLLLNFFALALSAFVPADIQVAALKDISGIAANQNIPVVAAENLTLNGSDRFQFYAPNLPTALFAGNKTPPASGEYLRHIKWQRTRGEDYPRCKKLTGSWWHQIISYLPEDALYTDRFTGYAILKCQP